MSKLAHNTRYATEKQSKSVQVNASNCPGKGSFVGSHAHTSVSSIRLEFLPGTGIANVVKLGDDGSEEDEGGSCRKNSLSQGLARGRVFRENSSVLGVISISH